MDSLFSLCGLCGPCGSCFLYHNRVNNLPLVVNDPARFDFRVRRSAMVDAAVLEQEMRRIFDRCWIYAGHASEVRLPGDFVTRSICGRPIMLCRDSAGAIRVFLNVCRHRGAVVCRERHGNARGYQCFYHGWSYDRDGRLDGVPGESSYPPSLFNSLKRSLLAIASRS